MVSKPKTKSTTISIAVLIKEGSVTEVQGALLKEWIKTVRAEERSKLLNRLVLEKIGTNEVENFMAGQVELRFEVGEEVIRDEENIGNLMEKKLNNSLKFEKQCRRRRGRLRSRLEELMKKRKTESLKTCSHLSSWCSSG